MTKDELEQLAGYFQYDGETEIAESIRNGTIPIFPISEVRSRAARLLKACQMVDELMAVKQERA